MHAHGMYCTHACRIHVCLRVLVQVRMHRRQIIYVLSGPMYNVSPGITTTCTLSMMICLSLQIQVHV